MIQKNHLSNLNLNKLSFGYFKLSRIYYFLRVRSWLRMNAGDVDKACKSSGILAARPKYSGRWVSNTWVTSPIHGYNPPKGGLIPDSPWEQS